MPIARHSPGDGGWCFPFDPYVPAALSPALWRPDIAPGTVALHPAPADYSTASSIELDEIGPVLADREDASGRHLVIDDPGGRIRLWLVEPDQCSGLVMIVAPDANYPLRRAAADRVARCFRGEAAGPQPRAFLPTDFQRQRLTLLLRLLELLASGLSTRELADEAVYPDLGLHGADWRGANERRQVQRLRDEAMHLTESGYLDLLLGR